MASSHHLPAFEEILRRGAASEPRVIRPVPKLVNGNADVNLSLKSAMEEGRSSQQSKVYPGQVETKVSSKVQKSNRKSKPAKVPANDEGFSSESSPVRKRTPMTLPRTKITAATPLEQKVALSRLKQKLNFEQVSTSAAEEAPAISSAVSTAGSTSFSPSQLNPATLRGFYAPVSSSKPNGLSMDGISISSVATSDVYSEVSELIDTEKIKQRLNQVREYLRQATSMYVNLSMSEASEPSRSEQLSKLAKLIQQLRVQEQGYIDLLQRTLLIDEANSNADATSIVSNQSQSVQMDNESEMPRNLQSQREELEKLREQHALLTKIVEQEKQLQDLKKRQSSLLQMQEDAELMIAMTRKEPKEKSPPLNNQAVVSKKSGSMAQSDTVAGQDLVMGHEDAASKRLELERKFVALQEKKEHMDSLLNTLKALEESQSVESSMLAVLGENPVSKKDLPSSYAAVADAEADLQDKLRKLNDVRERLRELKGVVADYENQDMACQAPVVASRDNRVTAQVMQQKQGNTLTGQGGARLRFPDGSQHPITKNELQNLKYEIESLIDNRNKPVPPASQQKVIDVARNPPRASPVAKVVRSDKSDNQQPQATKQPVTNEELQRKARESQQARAKNDYARSDAASQSTATQTHTDDGESSTSEVESEGSSIMQWKEDPEFQAKVRKLKVAKEKLHHLQELVKVVQQGGQTTLPIDDLADLSLLSPGEGSQSTSQYGESEEEAEEIADDDDDDEEDDDKEEDEVDEDEKDEDDEDEDNEDLSDCDVLANGEGSHVSKGSQQSYQMGDHVLTRNEIVYQEMLKKQRQELNALLKEREQLLETQQKLSSMARTSLVTAQTQTPPKNSPRASKEKIAVSAACLPLTKEEVSRQNSKQPMKRALISKLSNMSVEPQFGSESDYQVPTHGSGRIDSINDDASDYVKDGPSRTNALVVSELRRQRDMFEQKKKQTFVEKQRRKNEKKKLEENQSDDHATYSVHSDIDEGVGRSMFSADVTTAATWGGSTEQSSSSDNDSAVYEGYPDDDQPQMENEDREDGGNARGANEGATEMFSIGKYKERPRRNITWHADQSPQGKKRKLDEKPDENSRACAGSVSWSTDVSPPGSGDHRKQGNLTPAYKLMRDRENSRREVEASLCEPVPAEPLHTQLVSMCTSLLRNEQTLLSMLQSQKSSQPYPADFGCSLNTSNQILEGAMRNMRNFFEHPTESSSFEQTLRMLDLCRDRIEQHHRDLRYLHSQFAKLDIAGRQNASASTSAKSAWSEDVSGRSSSRGLAGATYVNTFPIKNSERTESTKPKALSSAEPSKGTQTETSLFDDPFVLHSHGYSLFGEASMEGALSPDASQPGDTFEFKPAAPQPNSPGTIGEKVDSDKQSSDYIRDSDSVADYRLRTSEYNPLSYADNFPKTNTANVITTSYLSLDKKRADTSLSEGGEKTLWPSFFKQSSKGSEKEPSQNAACPPDESQSTKYAVSQAKRSVSKEVQQNGSENFKKHDADIGENAGSNYSLFEALRDSIYSEVATLISMNESRPHYLIELFRELQLLSSDYLRQRALFALQDLVTRFLTEESSASSPLKAFQKEILPEGVSDGVSFQNWASGASEQTPSESAVASEDEEEASALQAMAKQIANNDVYDYVEVADTQSEGEISTPVSTAEIPFASEDLGNTVINLDEALEKMRLYERKMAEAKKAFEQISDSVSNSSPASQFIKKSSSLKRYADAFVDTVSNSSAGDGASECSSDMPQPSIDTQKLDRQIKAVMMELIPFLNDHMDTVCSVEFLVALKDTVMCIAKKKEHGSELEEFGRFFLKQLESILQDSLLKFNGRSLKECGEDMLIDISEVLFNELAFYKLMQDLDRPLYGDALGASLIRGADETASEGGTGQDESSKLERIDSDCVATDSEEDESSIVVHNVVDICMDEDDAPGSENIAESSKQFVNFELSVSESRPVRCSGSEEEDADKDVPLLCRSLPFQSAVRLSLESVSAGARSLEEHTELSSNPASQAEAVEVPSKCAGSDVDGCREADRLNPDVKSEPGAADPFAVAEGEGEGHLLVGEPVAVGDRQAGCDEHALGEGDAQNENKIADEERNKVEPAEGSANGVLEAPQLFGAVCGLDPEAESAAGSNGGVTSASSSMGAAVVLAHIYEQDLTELAGDPLVVPTPGHLKDSGEI